MLTNPFYELTALLFLASVLGFLGLLLKQPMIVSFIAVGVIAGPGALGLVTSGENIEILSELGIAVLLFLVGLKLDLKLVRSLGLVSLATGLGQVLFTSVIGFFIALALGLSPMAALYIAVALTFSSTIIVVKLLSDKKEVDSLHGKIALGFLIVQDLVVVLAMMMLSAFGIGGADGGNALGEVLAVLGYGAVMLLLILLFVRYLATPLTRQIARSAELLLIFAIAWAALLAALGEHLGFSMELGGLLAGVSLASTPYREAIVARFAPLRDFLLLFFFIGLGMELELELLTAQLGPALLLSVFVLVGNPLIVLAILGFLGYNKRTGFLAGLTVAQISEFSLIFMAMGLSLGHVDREALGLVTLVGLITIAVSVYMITYSHGLYRVLEPLLGVFQRRHPQREGHAVAGMAPDYDVVLFGLGRYGAEIADNLRRAGYRLLGVDFNPEEVRRWRLRGQAACYGDASDPEFIAHLPLEGVRWVLSSMPQHERGLSQEDPRLVLIDSLKQQGFQGRIAVSTQRAHEVEALRDRGADLVFLPFRDAAAQAVDRLRAAS